LFSSSDDLPIDNERKLVKSRLQQYKDGFEAAIAQKYGRPERLPSESPLPHLLALGEGLINSMEISGPGVEAALTVYDERIKEIVLKKIQFADQESSFQFSAICYLYQRSSGFFFYNGYYSRRYRLEYEVSKFHIISFSKEISFI
jgi:hypothetical protein